MGMGRGWDGDVDGDGTWMGMGRGWDGDGDGMGRGWAGDVDVDGDGDGDGMWTGMGMGRVAPHAIARTSMIAHLVCAAVSRRGVSTNSERSPDGTRSITKQRKSEFWKAYLRLTMNGCCSEERMLASIAIFLRHVAVPSACFIASYCITFSA
jgi:hypothetical protein